MFASETARHFGFDLELIATNGSASFRPKCGVYAAGIISQGGQHHLNLPPQQVMVDEDRMSDQDRRQVQVVLATLGYYSGRIDATFGPETRAAIRRYQFEIKAELTGRLTAEQATKLVNSVR